MHRGPAWIVSACARRPRRPCERSPSTACSANGIETSNDRTAFAAAARASNSAGSAS